MKFWNMLTPEEQLWVARVILAFLGGVVIGMGIMSMRLLGVGDDAAERSMECLRTCP